MSLKNLNRAALVLLAAGAAASAHAQAPAWEDKPIGASWTAGMSTMSHGVKVNFGCFQFTPPAGGTCGGYAEVVGPTPGCNDNHKLILNNINAQLDFAGSIGSQSNVFLAFGEYGGNINLAVNGDFRNFADFLDIDGATVGGCTIRVLSGGTGGDCGTLAVLGIVHQLVVGGQEFWIDHTDAPADECDYGFEDLVPLATLPLGSSTAAGPDSIASALQFIHPWTGPTFNVVRIRTSNFACGSGNEVEVNNARVQFKPSTAASYQRFTLKFYEASGGFVNLEIDGMLLFGEDFIDFDGMTVGSATISVPYGGFGDDCGQIVIEGAFDSVAIGGQQLYIDCLHDELLAVAGDLNGDGKVNGSDLAVMLSAWGTPNGDINGDQNTDANDMAVLLSNWS
ncbi:MAG: dockerin type I repeat-containing protein [Planctomycetaceae bacterium]|nr:dockerin type I repeat-containing protein [Planctomycetaceae bacterium]